MKFVPMIAMLLASTTLAATPAPADTLSTTKERGKLNCGVSEGVLGFSNKDEKGKWGGFDVDFCRAVAAATLGDPDNVNYVPLSTKARFAALQSGEVDLLSRQTTWTQSRDTGIGMRFVGTIYYDGQGFMVKKSVGVKSAKELSGATLCTETGTTTEMNAADFFKANKIKYDIISFEKADQTIAAFNADRCDVYTTDASALYSQRLVLSDPDSSIVLPEIISKEPLGPAVRQGDERWFGIVRWTLFALINAEELGVTKDNVAAQVESDNPEVRRFLGAEGNSGETMGLDQRWVYRIVAATGNYGEMFDRNLGAGSPLKIDRGLNALWNTGGLMYAPPIR